MSEKQQKPWFDRPATLKDGSKIAIIGGGICGLMMASHLSKFFEIIVIEEKSSLMAGASGNPIAILDPYIALNHSVETEFYFTAYKYAVDFYNELPKDVFQKCGLLKLPRNTDEKNKFSKLSHELSPSIVQKKKEGLFFHNAGYIIPKKLGEFLSQNFEILLNTKITNMTNSKNQEWVLTNDKDNLEIEIDAVIICNSFNSYHLEQAKEVKLEKISGQITYLKSEQVIDNVYCSNGYLTPPVKTEYGTANICGATFDRESLSDIDDTSHKKNIQNSPVPLKSINILGGRRNIRAMTNDHLPICGALPKLHEYNKLYEGLHHGPYHKSFSSAPYHKGLYITVGLGARGFLTSPLLASYMLSLMRGGSEPFNKRVQHALHPARFMIRKLSKK